MAKRERKGDKDEDDKGFSTYDLILLKTAELINDQGYAKISMRKIAEAAQVMPASIYYHFSSKDEIIDALMLKGLNCLIGDAETKLAKIGAEAPTAQKIQALISSYLSVIWGEDGYAPAYIKVYHQIPPVLKRRVRDTRSDYRRIWLDVFAAGANDRTLQPNLNHGLLVAFVLGALNRTVEWYSPRLASMEEFSALIVNQLFHGFIAD